jgi:cytidylate kinase
MIIVISGPSGSGKTTIAKILSNKLNLGYISAGELFRNMARNAGKDVLDLNLAAEKDFSIDKEIDKRILDIASKGNVVVESHIVGWLLKDIADYNIYIWASLEERSKRISKRDKISYPEAIQKVIAREESHYLRFWKYYGIDLLDLSVFDLCINTEGMSVDSIIDIILRYISSKRVSA